MNTKAAAAALVPRTSREDQRVRHAVAVALYGDQCSSAGAVAAVLELMQDPSDEVRNWATFALGRSIAVDSPEVRDALRSRLQDSYADARDEAMWDLALRKDRLGLTLLLETLESEEWTAGDEMAAAETLGLPHDSPVPVLREGLRKLLAESSEKSRGFVTRLPAYFTTPAPASATA